MLVFGDEQRGGIMRATLSLVWHRGIVFAAIIWTLGFANPRLWGGPSRPESDRSPIRFRNFEKLEIDSLKKPAKVIIKDGKIYILDSVQSQIIVTDLGGRLLSKIGRAGQGPGDLERPHDMSFASDGTLCVLNPAAKRIEVFNQEGTFRNRIRLKPPRDLYFSNPDGFLFLSEGRFLLTYSFSPHLIDQYQPSGEFKSEWAHRDLPIILARRNVGNATYIITLGPEEFLALDRFRGIFKIFGSDGIQRIEFPVKSKVHEENTKIVMDSIKGDSGTSGLHVETVLQWSTPFVDTNGDILVFSLFEKQASAQKLFAFSRDGELLYHTYLVPLIDKTIYQAYAAGDLFIFVSTEDEIYLGLREVEIEQ
jgi:hypothetical protein